jgi:large subunit ribosomal protein L25
MTLNIKAEKRDGVGKAYSRRLRQQGHLPAVLYGPNVASTSLVLSKKDIFNILKSESGENTLFRIKLDSKNLDVMIKDYQQDVVTDELLHVDLIEIAMDKFLEVTIPLVLVGEAVGVKSEGGFMDFVTREVEVECLPKDIPEEIEVDVSELHMHETVKVEELSMPEGVKILSDPQLVVAMVHAPEEEVEEEEEIEEEILAEGEEPEVIGKEKEEEEPEEEESKE